MTECKPMWRLSSAKNLFQAEKPVSGQAAGGNCIWQTSRNNPHFRNRHHASRFLIMRADDQGVKHSMEDPLARLEQALRREANAFARKAMLLEDRAMAPEALAERVSGVRICNASDIGDARRVIEERLSAERRRARRGSCRYDLNRHISLSRALEALHKIGIADYASAAETHAQKQPAPARED